MLKAKIQKKVAVKVRKVVAPKKNFAVKKKVTMKSKKTSPKGHAVKNKSETPVKKDIGIKRQLKSCRKSYVERLRMKKKSTRIVFVNGKPTEVDLDQT